jgi:phosphoribosylformimino-5-aminoimidazole carboxamide ribotide isomerase
MELIPAIDLIDGRCVRLYQGDYARETVYSDDPAEVAARWAALGAARLHVVDLDGAREGAPANLDVVKGIVSAVPIPVQLGGGIRSVETAREAVAVGVERVILGTVAVESPDIVEQACRDLGTSAVVVGVDARDGHVAVKGWTESKDMLATDLLDRMESVGVRRFMYTDISRDGTLTEPNFQAVEVIVGRTGAAVLAAGGISSVDHLIRLSELGVEGAIVGTALYTGDIDLKEALRALRRREAEQKR